jgi:hypothetical protein
VITNDASDSYQYSYVTAHIICNLPVSVNNELYFKSLCPESEEVAANILTVDKGVVLQIGGLGRCQQLLTDRLVTKCYTGP